jgi:Family of unknown function (DUF6776)
MKYATPKIVQPGGVHVWAWVGLVLLLVAAVGWNAFHMGRKDTNVSLPDLETVIAQQHRQIEQLTRERDGLLEKSAALEQAGLIDREAMRQVKKQLSAYQEERSKVEEELTFLRSMVADKKTRNGIQIREFKLERAGEKGVYRYRFAITRSDKGSDLATGSIFIAVDGIRNGQPKWLPLREITDNNAETLLMKFKQFQDVEGVIRLPDSFKPNKMIVEIKPNNNKLSPVKQRFNWAITSQGDS